MIYPEKLVADKPYAVTAPGADGKVKVVHPTHPAARQILSHRKGQEVPFQMLLLAGLANTDGAFVEKEYDEVATPEPLAASLTPLPQNTVAQDKYNADIAAAKAEVPAGYISAADVQARIDAAVAAANAAKK